MKNKKRIERIISLLAVLCMMMSLLPATVLAEDSPASGWTWSFIGDLNAKAYVDASTAYDGSQSVKLTNSSAGKANVYAVFSTEVPVKKNRTYRFSFASKGENVEGSINYCINWGERYVFKDMYGSNFDWKTKSFLWTNTEGGSVATIKIIVDGIVDGLWIDDFEFYEWDGEIVGGNLVSNPSFEKDTASIAATESDSFADIDLSEAKSAEEIASALKRTGSFEAEKYEEAVSMLSTMPLYKKEGIVIDGDDSDWDGIYTVHVPLSDKQYQVYSSSAALDMEMDYKAAYDDDNFYLYIETTDDKFFPDITSNYWANDSIQLAMGDKSESFGDEVGLQYTEDGGWYCSNSWRFDEVAKIKLKTLHEGKKTIYEAAIPWSVQFGSRPEKDFLFSILANDNDGDGRQYCLELRPGIAEGKTNKDFITYTLMQDGEEFLSTMEQNAGTYSVLVVNTSDEDKTFTVKSDILGLDKEVEIKAGFGTRIQSGEIGFKMGKTELTAEVSDGTVTRSLSRTVDVNPDENLMNELYEYYTEKVAELERLKKICRMLGYSTDYEEARIFVIKQFIEYMEDDFESGYYYPIAFANENLETMYNEAKTNMEAYIAGEKSSRDVPKFQTGDIEIDGQSIVADMKVGNKIERRPTFFIGYGHFFEVQRDIPMLSNITATAQAVEIGTSGIVSSAESANLIDGWTNYGINSLETLEFGQKETDGSNGKAFYAHNETPSGPNKYAFFYQTTEGLRRGETYVAKFRAKAKNATGCNMVFNEVTGARLSLDGTYDWTDFEFEITMKNNQTRLQWGIIIENLVDELWIDDLTLCKKGEDRNFCVNGSFDYTKKTVGKYSISMANVARLGEILDDLAENNQTLDLLLSPHYFPTSLLDNPSKVNGGFLSLDIENEQAREIIKLQIDELLTPYKDHPALKSIILTNEPTFYAGGNGDVYIGNYRAWLADKYNGDIAKLNENYGTSYASFDEVEWQTEDYTPGFYDYINFNAELFNDFHAFMAKCVKEVDEDLPVTAKPMDYNAYSDAGGKRTYHSNGTNQTLFAEWEDINGCDSWAYWNSTSYNTMQGKMQWYDFMRSIKKAPGHNSEDHIIADGNLDFVPEQAKWMDTDLWQGAMHGRNITNIWLWDSDYVNTPAGGSIRFRPDCIVAASDVAMDLNRLAYEVTALHTKDADVGILYSTASRNYSQSWMNAVYRAWESVVYNGRKAEYITEDQLDKMFDFPMLIVPENYNVPEETAKKVLEYAQNGGKVIMLGENCLKYNEYNKEINYNEKLMEYALVVPTEDANELMTSPEQADLKKLVGDELEKLGLKHIKVINTQTGEEINKADYIYTEYNGKIILNICRYEWGDDVEVRIEKDGVPVQNVIDLRKAEKADATITLSEYKPVFVEFDA